MSLRTVSGGGNWAFEGSPDSSKAQPLETSKNPLSLRAKALKQAIGDVGVGKISLGIMKVVGGIILRNTAKLLPSGKMQVTLQHRSKELKHSGIQTASKAASVYLTTLLKSGGWAVKVPLINIAKHQQVCSQPWAKPADTEAAEELIDAMLDNHLIREDRDEPLAKLGLARAGVRAAMKEFGVEDSEIHSVLREPASELEGWNKRVDVLRAKRDDVLKNHGVNDPRTSNIPEVKQAQEDLERALKVQTRLQKLVERASLKRDETNTFIRLTETPKGQTIARSGNLHYRYVDSTKLTAVRDGICFGSCIRWATQYNALSSEAKGNGKGLDALVQILSAADQQGMEVQATANQLTYQRLQYFPKVDFARSDAGKKHMNDVADAVIELAIQAGWIQEGGDVAALKQDIETLLSLYNTGRGPANKGPLYEAIAGKQDSPFRQTDYWQNNGTVAEKSASHFVKAVKSSLGTTYPQSSPLLKDETHLSAVIEFAIALQAGQTGMDAIKAVTNSVKRSELDLARKDIADQKVSEFIVNQRGYSFQPQTHLLSTLI